MAFNIDNDDVVELVRRLAVQRNIDLTEAIRLAVKHELERSDDAPNARHKRLRGIVERIASSPVRDPRPPDALLEYDTDGLPK